MVSLEVSLGDEKRKSTILYGYLRNYSLSRRQLRYPSYSLSGEPYQAVKQRYNLLMEDGK